VHQSILHDIINQVYMQLSSRTTMASVEDTLKSINDALKQSDERPYHNYSCKTVSWDDVQRGTVGGSLSCWGSNITDTRLYAKDGRKLFTVRGDNWNERLGKVTADDLALIATDLDGGGSTKGLRPVTLRSVLKNISAYGEYANLTVDSLMDEKLDKEISVRFQTTFLPVESGEKQTLEFAPEAYNYNTNSDEDPRNIVFLCTTQGLAIQQDGKGAKKLFHHVRNDDRNSIDRYWLEAESSSHKVGGSQEESKEEREDALKRGKATSAVIGTKGIGSRFNVLMTIQIPLEQQNHNHDYDMFTCSTPMMAAAMPMGMFGGMTMEMGEEMEEGSMAIPAPPPPAPPKHMPKRNLMFRRNATKSRRPLGKSSAARVSRGCLHDSWSGLQIKEPKRNSNEHITATIVLYYTCSGGVPSSEDVKSAIDDLEHLYKDLEINGKLGEEAFDFMKAELTVKDVVDITNKGTYVPPAPAPVLNPDVFPK
jgi:hypothetical protein